MLKLISSIIAAASVAASATYYTTSAYYEKTTVVEVPDLYTAESNSRVMQKLDRYLDRELARLDQEDAAKARTSKFFDMGPRRKEAKW